MSIPELKQPMALPEELRSCTGFLMARVGLAMKMGAFEEFERVGLNPYGYAVLAVLAEGARETQATIADTLNVDRGQLVGLLDELEEAGAIERKRDQNDRRRHMVSLTPLGKKQLVKMRGVVKRIEDTFLGTLSDEERETLRETLQRVAAANDCRFQAKLP